MPADSKVSSSAGAGRAGVDGSAPPMGPGFFGGDAAFAGSGSAGGSGADGAAGSSGAAGFSAASSGFAGSSGARGSSSPDATAEEISASGWCREGGQASGKFSW